MFVRCGAASDYCRNEGLVRVYGGFISGGFNSILLSATLITSLLNHRWPPIVCGTFEVRSKWDQRQLITDYSTVGERITVNIKTTNVAGFHIIFIATICNAHLPYLKHTLYIIAIWNLYSHEKGILKKPLYAIRAKSCVSTLRCLAGSTMRVWV